MIEILLIVIIENDKKKIGYHIDINVGYSE